MELDIVSCLEISFYNLGTEIHVLSRILTTSKDGGLYFQDEGLYLRDTFLLLSHKKIPKMTS